MPAPAEGIPAIAWLHPEQAGLVRALASHAKLSLLGVGITADARRRAEPSPFGDSAAFTDLRQALATMPIRVALLAAPPEGAETDESEHDLLRLARSRELTILTLEPIPGSVGAARLADPAPWVHSFRYLGLFRAAPALATANELLQSFGTPRTLTVSFRSGRGQGSLGSRLFDAMHTVQSILGVPETIDASIITAVAASGLRLEPAVSLRALHGDLTANLRYAGAKSAAISLSDRAGRWFRGVAVVGESGCIRMDESGVERIDADGQVVEKAAGTRRRSPAKGTALFDEIIDTPAFDALADAARRALDPRAPKPEPFDLEAVLSMCEAAMLSARTCQAESPATVVRMA